MEKLLALKKDAAAERNPMRRQSEHTIRVKKTQDELDEKEEKVGATRSDQDSADSVLFGRRFFSVACPAPTLACPCPVCPHLTGVTQVYRRWLHWKLSP
jgi:hypothetical protein